jgi:hypothetical protein
MTKTLIDTATGDAVTIAGPALPDGRVLVQRVENGTVAVIDVHQLDVVTTE